MIGLTKKHKTWVVITVAFLIVIAGASLWLASSLASRKVLGSLFQSGTASPTAAEYMAWTGIWLPDAIEAFQAYGEGWQDWLIEARFDMEPTQLAEFIGRNQLQRLHQKSSVESYYQLEWFQSPALDEYQIHTATHVAASTTKGFYPSIWIAQQGPDTLTVYIRAFNT